MAAVHARWNSSLLSQFARTNGALLHSSGAEAPPACWPAIARAHNGMFINSRLTRSPAASVCCSFTSSLDEERASAVGARCGLVRIGQAITIARLTRARGAILEAHWAPTVAWRLQHCGRHAADGALPAVQEAADGRFRLRGAHSRRKQYYRRGWNRWGS